VCVCVCVHVRGDRKRIEELLLVFNACKMACLGTECYPSLERTVYCSIGGRFLKVLLFVALLHRRSA
jgi:hypothetical protein